jgi:UPF0755 protein
MKKILLTLVVVIILAGGFFAWKFFGPAVSSSKNKFLYISTGSDMSDVRNELLKGEFIKGTGFFDLTAKIIGYEKVKPGKYELNNGMSLVNLVRMLNNGRQTPVNFVITKLRTRENLASRIGKAFETDSTTMMALLNNNDSLRQYGLDTNTVMAAAMPYTYTLKWNSTPEKIFGEFCTAYKRFWNDQRKVKADSLGLNPHQVSALASIVEEETNAASDKPNIASVYLNRLDAGMPLQADPTLKYAIKDFGIKRVLNIHKETVSPYNTYRNKGLPPGPICTPSVETIDAVLNAPKTKYYYFVANSNFDGTHIFSNDYAEHMKHARIYQGKLNKIMAERKASNQQ